MKKLNPKIALANSYMEHYSKVKNKGQTLWVRTPNGYCHASRKESEKRAEKLKAEALSLYEIATQESIK